MMRTVYMSIRIHDSGLRTASIQSTLAAAVSDVVAMAFDAQKDGGSVELRTIENFQKPKDDAEDEWSYLDDKLKDEYDLYDIDYWV